jgi:FixJ family two-component response regulator
MTGPAKKVFIVDDDDSFLRSIERLLRSAGYATECFSSAEEFLVQRPSGAAGCILADLQMPGMDGMALQATLAQSADPLPIVFLTGHGDIPISVEAMRQGAEDFLVKTAPKELVIAAIERALARNARERSALAHRQRLQSRFEKLTPREHEVLSHVMQGKRNKGIADDLGIDERSVKRHRTNLMRKLGVTSVAELVQLAVESGMAAEG